MIELNYYLRKLVYFDKYFELKQLKKKFRSNKEKGISAYESTNKLLKKPIVETKDLELEYADKIRKGMPFLVARLGNTEGTILGQYLGKKFGINKGYNDENKKWLLTTSGFFADDYENVDDAIDKYAELTLDGLSKVDYLCARWPESFYQPFFFHRFARNAVPTSREIWPYESPTAEMWYSGLAGKKVLVINSFADSIQRQFERKSELVNDPSYELPDFDLITYKSYVTQVGERPGNFRNFFEVLETMENDIVKLDFDVAIVGAGAYGFPLSVFIKDMGKCVMETCSSTSLYFGVYGQRHINCNIDRIRTDAWIRPIEQPPQRYKEVENGCYW